ncbi:MAG: peptide-methionine (S)-S-oxide reductase MsrA [Burkholderiaceae bacterium]
MSIAHPLDHEPHPRNEFATLGGGCFWCLEAVFEEVQGVVEVESGYSGGAVRQPSYRHVCGGDTGHAEVVRIEFDPARVSFRELLDIFFAIHDPTTPDRQGNDVGSQYRSVIFFHSSEQERIARATIAEVQAALGVPVVTERLPAPDYTRAETYHQEYFRHNPGQGYCQFVVEPKLAQFRQTFAARRKPGA